MYILFKIFPGSGDEYEPSKKERKEYREEMYADVENEEKDEQAQVSKGSVGPNEEVWVATKFVPGKQSAEGEEPKGAGKSAECEEQEGARRDQA